jgi:hypothetical protein
MDHFKNNLTTLMENAKQRAMAHEAILPPPTISKPEKEPYDVGGAELKKLYALLPKRK